MMARCLPSARPPPPVSAVLLQLLPHAHARVHTRSAAQRAPTAATLRPASRHGHGRVVDGSRQGAMNSCFSFLFSFSFPPFFFFVRLLRLSAAKRLLRPWQRHTPPPASRRPPAALPTPTPPPVDRRGAPPRARYSTRGSLEKGGEGRSTHESRAIFSPSSPATPRCAHAARSAAARRAAARPLTPHAAPPPGEAQARGEREEAARREGDGFVSRFALQGFCIPHSVRCWQFAATPALLHRPTFRRPPRALRPLPALYPRAARRTHTPRARARRARPRSCTPSRRNPAFVVNPHQNKGAEKCPFPTTAALARPLPPTAAAPWPTSSRTRRRPSARPAAASSATPPAKTSAQSATATASSARALRRRPPPPPPPRPRPLRPRPCRRPRRRCSRRRRRRQARPR